MIYQVLYIGMRKFKPRYKVNKISKLPYISEIFQSDENGFYTDALMYQDILRFSDDKTCFTRTEVDNWLLRHNQELINDYKDLSTRNIPYSTRRANKKDRLDRIFNNLLDMKVIVHSGTTTAKKLKKMDIETYSINKSGKLILEIIKNMSLKNELFAAQKNDQSEELENNHLMIYDLITSIFVVSEDIPYRSTVFKEFLINLQNKKLFSKFVDYVILIVRLNHYITSISHLVHVVLDLMLNRAPERNLFIDLFYESASSLGPEGKEIFLYDRKLEIEENFKNNIKGYSREYEKRCFDKRADYNNILLEGECNKCKRFSVIELSHDGYKNLNQDAFGNMQKFDCEHCQSKESCSLPTF